MPIVSCNETDCQRKVQARGMCSTHYSYWHREHNGRVDKAHAKVCGNCGKGFTTPTKQTVYCTLVCAQAARPRKPRPTAIVKYHKPREWHGNTLRPLRHLWTAGQCAYCPNYFIGAAGSKYCSERCSSNAGWKRRYDRRGEFKVTDKLRLSIYERDAYECQLCQGPVDATLHYQDPMAATLDHIIPQSWMLIPDHSEANLRLAHRACNSARGDRLEAA